MDGEKWRRAHALSEQALSAMKSRLEQPEQALVAGLDGEAATIRKRKDDIVVLLKKVFDVKNAELNAAQRIELNLKIC